MRIYFTLVLLCSYYIAFTQFIVPTLPLAETVKPLTKYETADWSANNTWVMSEEFNYSYNNDYTQLIEILSPNVSKTTYDYNGQSLTRTTNFSYTNNNYLPTSKSEYAYGSCSDIPTTIVKFSYTNQNWIPSQHYNYTLNSNCLVDSIYSITPATNTVANYEIYRYNNTQQIISKVITSNPQGDTAALYGYSYSNGLLSERIELGFNLFSFKEIYSRNINNDIDTVLFHSPTNINMTTFYTAPNWQLTAREILTYNNQNQLINKRRELLDNTQQWINSYQLQYQYDADGDLVTLTRQDWDGSNFVNNTQATYSYAFAVATDLQTVPTTDCLFSNPYTKGDLINCTDLAPQKDYVFTMYDLLGRPIFQNRIQDNHSFSINSAVPDGFYVITLQEEGAIILSTKIWFRN